MKVEWESGGAATFRELEADRVRLHSEVAAAPGTPLVGSNSAGVRYSVKVRTCRKLTDAPVTYLIEGRLFSMTRAERIALAESLVAPVNEEPGDRT